MNARHFVKMSVFVLLLSPASVLAQDLTLTRLTFPDLEPADLGMDADCRLVVTIRNNGPAVVPDAAYSLVDNTTTVQMFKGNSGWGGTSLGSLDKSHLSQPVGGTVTFPWLLGPVLPPGTHQATVNVDYHNTLKESNESNNSRTETFTCQKGPDLVATNISLVSTGPSVTSPCQIVLTLKNNGNGVVPLAAFAQTAQAPTIQMFKGSGGWGGAALGIFDPSKVLQPAGATLTKAWLPGAQNLWLPPGEYTLRVDVDNNNALVETNEANNSFTKKVQCGVVLAPPLPGAQ